MAQAILYSAGGGYSLGPGTGSTTDDVLIIPPTFPAVGRSSIFFNWVSATAGTGTPRSPSSPYFVTFIPTTGLPIIVTGNRIGFFPANQNLSYAMYGVAIEDYSGNLIDSVASGGVISLGATLGGAFFSVDTGACAAVVFQADSPPDFAMRPVGMGTFPFNGVAKTTDTIGAINTSTGPFISLLVYSAANGGANPVFGTPSNGAISLTPLNAFAANNATIVYNTYISPVSWGWTIAHWFLLPPGPPFFTIAATWTGSTNVYGATAIAIAHEPFTVLPPPTRTRSYAQVIG